METQTQTSQATMTPAEALARLKEGNARFVANRRIDRDLLQQVGETASGQYPFAIVLGCVDSRVSPELVFDQGIGDLFGGDVDAVASGLAVDHHLERHNLHTECRGLVGRQGGRRISDNRNSSAASGPHVGHATPSGQAGTTLTRRGARMTTVRMPRPASVRCTPSVANARSRTSPSLIAGISSVSIL